MPRAAPPLVGRDDELAWLRAHWRRARGRARRARRPASAPHGHRQDAARGGARRRGAPGRAAPSRTARRRSGAPDVARARRRAAAPTLLVARRRRRGRAGAAALRAGRRASSATRRVLVLATATAAAALARPSASLALGPLDAAAVRRSRRSMRRRCGASPSRRCSTRAAACPRRVHGLAREWARREAARRVDASADRAAAGRARARALEAELAGSVAELQSARERAERADAGDGAGGLPVQGPRLLRRRGRRVLLRARAARRRARRAAGRRAAARRSSAPRGAASPPRCAPGCCPRSRPACCPGSDGWTQVAAPPRRASAARAARRDRTARAADGRLLIAVDQFEESFTACRDARRARGVRRRRSSQRRRDRRRRRARGARRLLRPLRRVPGARAPRSAPTTSSSVRCAATSSVARSSGPPQRAGLRVEPALVDALLADVAAQPGALPLLSTRAARALAAPRRAPAAARRLRAHRRRARRGRAAGRGRAYGRLAAAASRRVARALLLRLGDEDDGGASSAGACRWRSSRPSDDRAARRSTCSPSSRLLTVSDGAVEVAHEALLREWPRLRGWLEEDAEGRRLHRHLTQAARDWGDGGRDRGELYRGARLASALEWRAGHEPSSTRPSGASSTPAAPRASAPGAGSRLALAGVLALLVARRGRGAGSRWTSSAARAAQAAAADAQRLGAQALNEPALDRSLLLARQGVALDDTPGTRDNLLAALRRSPAAIGVMRGDGDGITAPALHPDGHTLAVGDFNGTVVFLDARTRRRLGEPHQTGARSPRSSSLAFSPDGSASRSPGRDAQGGFVDLFEGRPAAHHAPGPGDPLWDTASACSFSPDSARARVPDAPRTRLAQPAAALATRGRERGSETIRQIPGRASSVLGFIGARLGDVEPAGPRHVVRDAVTLRRVRRSPVAGPVAAMSPARGLVAFGSRDGSVRLLDPRSGRAADAPRAATTAPWRAMRVQRRRAPAR